MPRKRKIGITTTIPVEAVFAAGCVPVDLNNRFIADDSPTTLIERAEREGFPRNMCAWIKGIYGTVIGSDDIDAVIAVTHGDCSNTQALMETLQHRGRKVIPFAFLHDRNEDSMRSEIGKLAHALGATWDETLAVHEKIKPVRDRLAEIDEMTWQSGLVSGEENYRWLVTSSDFEGDVDSFATRAEKFANEASERKPQKDGTRIALLGIPPIFSDLLPFLESKGARVVFNEIPRQFSMPRHGEGLVKQYLRYTYPYDIFYRLWDIREEISRRRVDGAIHYVQSFCFRQIQDIIMRESIDLSLFSLEGDRPGPLDARTRMRLETFIEILQLKKNAKGDRHQLRPRHL